MDQRPWRAAGVSKGAWDRARRGVIQLVADLVWASRRDERGIAINGAMERLDEIRRGEPAAVKYGLDVAERLNEKT